MLKEFVAYVFRPHRVILAAISLLGIIGDGTSKIYWIVFVGSVFNFILR